MKSMMMRTLTRFALLEAASSWSVPGFGDVALGTCRCRSSWNSVSCSGTQYGCTNCDNDYLGSWCVVQENCVGAKVEDYSRYYAYCSSSSSYSNPTPRPTYPTPLPTARTYNTNTYTPPASAYTSGTSSYSNPTP